MATKTLNYEAVVIGAGPGGYVAGIRLGQLGVHAAVIEREYVGGVCLNVGCIPSKALIEASKRYEALAHGSYDVMGIGAADARVDMARLQEWKGSVVSKLTGGVRSLLKANGTDVIEGTARFDSPGRLLVQTAEGTVVVEAKHIVVATGSRPIEIGGFAFDGEKVLSSTEALALEEVPKRLLVVGGGYIGVELGGVFARFGSKVTIVELTDQLLPGVSADLVRFVQRKFRKLGVDVRLGARAVGFEETASGLAVRIETGSGAEAKADTLEVDRILVTVGRRPFTGGLGLEAIGLETDERGFLPVDSRLRTKVPGVYAIGDVVGGPMLAHKASKEGETVAEVIAGRNVELDVRAIPAVIFSDPEIAVVGMNEAKATQAGHKVRTGRFSFGANGRALGMGEGEGFARVVADADTDEVLGVEIVGPNACDLIAEAALAIEMGATAQDIALTVHAHPTLPEVVMEAAKAVHGEAIHAVNRPPRRSR